MYLYVGQNELLPEEQIVGVFDLDKCTTGARAREFLRRAEAAGEVLDVSGNLPRSFAVCTHPYHEQVVYLSQLSPATLKRRWEQGGLWGAERDQAGKEEKAAKRGRRHGGE